MRFFALTLVTLISVLEFSQLRAEDLAVSTTIYCQDKSLSQVFEACEEVQLLEQTGSKIRVYSKPKQQVMTLKPETLFVARLAASGEKLSVGERITVLSGRIWNSSRPGFLGLCTIDEIVSSDRIKVSCGRYRNEVISKSAVYRLRPFDLVTQKSEFKIRSTAAN